MKIHNENHINVSTDEHKKLLNINYENWLENIKSLDNEKVNDELSELKRLMKIIEDEVNLFIY